MRDGDNREAAGVVIVVFALIVGFYDAVRRRYSRRFIRRCDDVRGERAAC